MHICISNVHTPHEGTLDTLRLQSKAHSTFRFHVWSSCSIIRRPLRGWFLGVFLLLLYFFGFRNDGPLGIELYERRRIC